MSPQQSRILFPALAAGILLTVILFTAGCTGTGASPSPQSALENDISALTGGPQYANASLGIIVVDPATGTVLYESNADRAFVPGSTTKLFSAAAVLEAFGADYRFVTPVYATAVPDPAGRIEGNLVLVASGDPDMGGRTLPDGTIAYTDLDHGDANSLGGAVLPPTDPLAGLNDLAMQVHRSGITQVSDVVIDDRLFETTDLGKTYVLSPIIINDNLIDITITPSAAGTAPALAMRPETGAYRLVNRATTGPAGNPPAISITEEPAGTIVVSGTVASDAGPVNRTLPVGKPAVFARTLFIEALERQGVTVNAATTGDNPAVKLPAAGSYSGLRKVADLTSLPLSEDVRLTLKVSQNLHADTYVLLVAKASNKTGFYDGMMREGTILRSLGLDTRGISLGDGEGGVEEDRISPRAAAQLLTLMGTRPYAAEYKDALPVLGVDGTLASSCTAGNPACGHVYAKTGTRASYDPLNNRGLLLGKSIAGYMDAKSGRHLVFAIFVNNVPFADIDDMMATGDDLGNIAGLIYEYY